MTLVISTGVSLSSSWLFPADPDAAAYVAAVEAADGQTLETATKAAIDNFVIGCKADGIWNAIKASCIMAGARTLAGALVPLKGTAPTNFNFVAGDYNRKTGLVGNGSTKYLNSNRANNADPQNSKHLSAFITTPQSTTKVFIGCATSLNVPGDSFIYTQTGFTSVRLHSSLSIGVNNASPLMGLAGANRDQSSSFAARLNGAYYTLVNNSQPPIAENIHIFKGGDQYANPRLSFYSIGEAIDLALLDARVTGLMNDFAAVIP